MKSTLEEIDQNVEIPVDSTLTLSTKLPSFFKKSKTYEACLKTSLEKQLHIFQSLEVRAVDMPETVKERTSCYLDFWCNFDQPNLQEIKGRLNEKFLYFY